MREDLSKLKSWLNYLLIVLLMLIFYWSFFSNFLFSIFFYYINQQFCLVSNSIFLIYGISGFLQFYSISCCQLLKNKYHFCSCCITLLKRSTVSFTINSPQCSFSYCLHIYERLTNIQCINAYYCRGVEQISKSYNV